MKRMMYIAIGTAAGCINGLFGAGGGLLLVPLLSGVGKLPPKQAFATSLSVMLPLSAVSLFIYVQRGAVAWHDALPYVLGGVIGGVIAGRFMSRVRVRWLRSALAVFLLYGGIKAVMLW